MYSRVTKPIEIIEDNEKNRIGVIGTAPGSGASFICNLLEREKFRCLNRENQPIKSDNYEIIDLGECDEKEDLNCVLIVIDCRKDFPDKVFFALKALGEKNTKCGLILNHWIEDFEVPDSILNLKSSLICFKVPTIEVKNYTDLFNFVFYS